MIQTFVLYSFASCNESRKIFNSLLCLAQISDLIRYDSSKGEETLVYILTLGVVETYRKRGIGSDRMVLILLFSCLVLLILTFCLQQSRLLTRLSNTLLLSLCAAVFTFTWLHTTTPQSDCTKECLSDVWGGCTDSTWSTVSISILSCSSTLSTVRALLARPCKHKTQVFFLAFILKLWCFLRFFIYFISGCICRDLAVSVLNYMRTGIRSVASKLTMKQEEKGLKWLKCKDNARCLLPTQTKRNVASERLSSGYDYV